MSLKEACVRVANWTHPGNLASTDGRGDVFGQVPRWPLAPLPSDVRQALPRVVSIEFEFPNRSIELEILTFDFAAAACWYFRTVLVLLLVVVRESRKSTLP